MKKKPTQSAPVQNPQDQETVSEVLHDFQQAYSQKTAKDVLFREIYQRYRSYLDKYRETTRSTLFIPESFKIIETISPRLTAQKPGWKVLPRDSEDITEADKVSGLLSYRYDMQHMHPKIKMYVKQALIYGTSFMKVGWDGDRMSPTAELVDIADIYGDPKTFDWENGYIIHRYYRTMYDLEHSPVPYKNLDVLKTRTTKDQETSARDDQLRQQRFAIQGIPYNTHREGFEILEKWYFEEGKVRVCAVADRGVLIREEDSTLPLQEYPFIPLYDQQVPFEKWGIGEIEPILDLQDELNTTRNQRIDEKNLSIHNMWIVSKTAGVDYKTIMAKPGGIILANDINGIKALDKQNITADSINEINLIQADIKEVTGVNNFILGEVGNRQSATAATIISQAAAVRFQEKVNNLEIALKKIGHWFVALDKAFLKGSVKVRVEGKFGPETYSVTKGDIPAFYDVDIESGSSLPANPDLRRQQLKELIQVIAPYLMSPNGIPEGMRELLRLTIQSYDLENTDDILQGASHPLVNQAMAQLDPNEMQGVNPQIVEQIIKRNLTAVGGLQHVPEASPAGQTPQAPPARDALPATGHSLY